MPEKDKTETQDKAAPPPAVDTKSKMPEKVAGPQPGPAGPSPASSGSKTPPTMARAADLLSGGKQDLGPAQRARMTGSMQQSVGNARVGRMLGTGVQPKTEVSSPEDGSEKEAEQVADKVMRTSDAGTGTAPSAPMGSKPEAAGAGGQPMPKADREFMEPRFGRDFGNVRLHTDPEAQRQATAVGAKAFTKGSDISFAPGSGPDDKKLLAHELTHVAQQDSSGPTASQPIRRQAGGTRSALAQLDEMLAMSDVPEEQVIFVVGLLNPAEKKTLLAGGYKSKIADALNIREMVRAVNRLKFPLTIKLEWVNAAADSTSDINYPDVKAMVLTATQPERDELKTFGWRKFFVHVCSDATMIEAVNDLGFDLATKLEWLEAQVDSVDDLNYSNIKSMVTSAPQAQRDVLKTTRWREFFVEVCTDATIAVAVDDLGWDLATKLDWMIYQGTKYKLVKPRIVAALAPERAAVLSDQALLRRLKNELGWSEFAMCVELLGRSAPTADQMLLDGTVSAAMAAAFKASSPAVTLPPHNPRLPVDSCNPPAGTPSPTVHEEGGWIYLNLITGNLETRPVASGGQARLDFNEPPDEIKDSIVVGYFHSHPNIGKCWDALSPSGKDTNTAFALGVPNLVITASPTVTNIKTFWTGPTKRIHLAGKQGYPGVSGGKAPN